MTATQEVVRLSKKVNIILIGLILAYAISFGCLAAVYIGDKRAGSSFDRIDSTFRLIRTDHKTAQDSTNKILYILHKK